MSISRTGADLASHSTDAAGIPWKVRPCAAVVALLAALVGAGLHARPAAQRTVDVSRLPLNLDRIQRELRQSVVREERKGLNLRYVVDVSGQATPIVFFEPEANLVHGPVPYGAPTHRDMIEQVTPREYRAPAADFSALLRWLADRARKR